MDKQTMMRPYALAIVSVLLTAASASPLMARTLAPETVIAKKLTKAECLEKPGYVWIEETKRCVKDNRGSH